jgi:hypothetical protein
MNDGVVKVDALGVIELHPLHKCVIAVKMLGRGSIADDMDDLYAVEESIVLECVKEFTHTIVGLYEAENVRPPNACDMHHILQENKARGFPGMLESIDCMYWEWSSCPMVYHGDNRGHNGKPTIILEAVASKSL